MFFLKKRYKNKINNSKNTYINNRICEKKCWTITFPSLFYIKFCDVLAHL